LAKYRTTAPPVIVETKPNAKLASVEPEAPSVQGSTNGFALFSYGFRPFFLLGGTYAFIVIPWWMYRFAHASLSFDGMPAMYWHAHEMIYGFVMAAIAGFLLTAVPSWTGERGFAGKPLVAAAVLWLAGRLAMGMAGEIPFWVLAVAELALVPWLITLLAPPILRTRNRNLPLLAVLLVLWIIDAVFLASMVRADVTLAAGSTRLAIDFVLVLITVIAGRIVPAFTANALRRRGGEPNLVTRTPLEFAVIGLMVSIAIADIFVPIGILSGVLAALAALAHIWRLSGWRSFRTGGEPILWIMHVAYAWLPIGLALKAFAILGDASWASKWQHALATGAMATMILAVMTRSALGHTGRPLVVSRAIAVAYLLLTFTALLRTFGVAVFPTHYLVTLTVSALTWMACFGIFIVVYAPILWRPRVDGRPG
jgi:uncharacterized protein involved in response to NO